MRLDLGSTRPGRETPPLEREGRRGPLRLEKAEGWADRLGIGLGVALALVLIVGLVVAALGR